jgi:hypothetical protein
VYLDGRSEAELAALQQNQGPHNDCAEYAIAASLNLLFGGSVRGSDVAAAADQVPWALPHQGLRMWENGPTSPAQQANIVNGIARQGGLPLEAEVTQPTPEELGNLLGRGDTAVVVTLGWPQDQPPHIAQGDGLGQPFADPGTLEVLGVEVEIPVGGHAMLLGAHDPGHVDTNGDPTPWGFINSWADGASAANPGGATEIYWMSDADFREAYNYSVIGNAVVITRQSPPAATPEPEPTPTAEPEPAPTPGPTPTPTPEAPDS